MFQEISKLLAISTTSDSLNKKLKSFYNQCVHCILQSISIIIFLVNWWFIDECFQYWEKMKEFKVKFHHVIADSENSKILMIKKIKKKKKKKNTDLARDEQRNVNHDVHWSKFSKTKKMKFLEQCFLKLYDISKLKVQTLLKKSFKRWMMQISCTSESKELNHFCKICHHVDFQYLINCSLVQVLKNFKLFSLKWVLLCKKDCAFYCLIAKIVKDALKEQQIMIETQRKNVICDFRIFLKTMNSADCAKMILLLILQSENINDFSHLILFKYHTEKDVMMRMTNHEISIKSLRVDCELIKRWCHCCVSKQCESNSSIVQDWNLSQKFHLIDVNQQCIVAYKQNV